MKKERLKLDHQKKCDQKYIMKSCILYSEPGPVVRNIRSQVKTIVYVFNLH